MTRGTDLRLPALRRFAAAITLLNVLGHTWFGFEQSWAAPLVGLAAAYGCEILLEAISARQQGRRPRFMPAAGTATGAGGSRRMAGAGAPIDFLLSAHITGLAVSMLLYSGERLWPIAFAAAVAIGSKYVFRVETPDGGSRHFFNPSNLGITVTLLLLTYVGLAQPYMFTENLNATGAWLLPAVLVCAGTFLNGRFTRKLPLVAGWVGGFGLQALVRWAWFGNLPRASLMPLTGVALLLFTFYMVTDPATTPVPAGRQVAFGAAVAGVYGVLLASHVVFTPFLALTLVSSGRGALLWVAARRLATAPEVALRERPRPAPAPAPAAARPLRLVEPLGRAPEPEAERTALPAAGRSAG